MQALLQATLQGSVFALLFFGVYYVPGQLAWRLLPESDESVESLPFSLGLGVVMINTAAMLLVGLVGLFLPLYMSAWIVVGVSLSFTGGLALLHRQRHGRLLPRWPLRPTRDQLAVWVLTTVALIFFSGWYNLQIQDEDACIIRAATSVDADYLDSGRQTGETKSVPLPQGVQRSSKRNAFMESYFGQRMGPGVLVAPFLALFGTFGLRLVFALHGLLMPGLGFLLGRQLTGRSWGGLATALLLTFGPYAMEIQYLDENLMSSSFGTLALAALLRRRPSAIAAGMALSLFLGIRHIGVLVLPGVLLYLIWSATKPRKELAHLALGLTLFSLPYLVYHANMYLMFDWIYEAQFSRPPAPHSFLGLFDFKTGVLLNWPFVASPLRSPHTAFPPLIAFPLDLVRRYGVLLIALVPAGIFALYTRARPKAWLLALWFGPTMAMLMVQSNWMEPAKMGVPASVIAPLVLAMVMGAVWLAEVSWPKKIAVAAFGVSLPLALVPSLAAYRAPVDTRVNTNLPGVIYSVFPRDTQFQVNESAEALQWERSLYSTLHALPALGYGHWTNTSNGQDVQELVDNLAHPAVTGYTLGTRSLLRAMTWGWLQFVGPLSRYRDLDRKRQDLDMNAPRLPPSTPLTPDKVATFLLDLSRAPFSSPAPLHPAAPGTTPALSLLSNTVYVILNLRVPWANGPMQLIAHRQPEGRVVIALVPQMLARPDLRLQGLKLQVLDQNQVGGLKIPIALPVDNLLLLAEARSLIPPRTLARPVIVHNREIDLSLPKIFY